MDTSRPSIDPKKLKKKFEKKVREIADVQNPSVRFARKLGYFARKYRSENRRNAPDYIFASPFGIIFWIEFKAPGKDLEPGQKDEIKAMRANGCIVYVIDDKNIAKRVLRHHVASGSIVRAASKDSECPEHYA